MINLEIEYRRDAVRSASYIFSMYTKDHPGFFSDDAILKNQRNITISWIKELEKDL